MSRRTEKVASLIQNKLGEFVLKKLKDPRIGFVTITGVDVSVDLKEARVYYSVLGKDEEKIETGRALAHAAGYLQHEIAQALKLRFTPKLTFHLDESLEEGEKIERILRHLEKERSKG